MPLLSWNGPIIDVEQAGEQVAIPEQPRETAGATMRLVVDYVRRAAGEDGVRRMLELAGEQRPLSVLEDERVWSSYAAKVALFAAAAEVTGQPDVGRRIGEGALESSVGGSLKLLLGLVGSPAQLVRGIARVNNKFSTAADMTALSSEPTSAVIRYQVREGYPPHLQDCSYTMGLLTQVPRVFGLPPADVVHEVCQVEGADACLYLLRWRERPSRFRRRRVEAAGPTAGLAPSVVSARLRDLQATVAELVAGRSVEEVLTVVTEHARAAVGAQRFLLVTRLDEGRPPRINADGFRAEDAERAAALLLADREPVTGGHALVVPVRSMTRDYGRLAAFGRTAFFEHEHDLLRSYASLAATALDAITALDVARDRQRIAEVLLDFARSLLGTRDTLDVAAATASAARSLVDADAATVLLYDDVASALRVIASCGWPVQLQPDVDAFTIQAEDTEELGELLRHPDDTRVYDRDTADPWIRKALEAFDTAQIVATPLRSTERLWGLTLTCWREGHTLTDPGRVFERLSGLADQAVAALDRAALTEQVHRQATEDMLTGLANRRAFTDRLERLLGQRDRTGVAAGVIFLDLDKFKEVNDRLGHGEGDALLCVVARRLRALVRAEDLVARIGGDEFTVLLPAVRDHDALAQAAKRIVDAFREPIEVGGTVVETHPSVGAVLVTPAHATVSEVLRHADTAMYAAKHAGGDRYDLYGADGDDAVAR